MSTMPEGNQRCIRVGIHFWNMNIFKGGTMATTKGDEKEEMGAFNLIIKVTILTLISLMVTQIII